MFKRLYGTDTILADNITSEVNSNGNVNLYDDLNRLKHKKIILVGDSYADGYTPDGNVKSWSARLVDYFGAMGMTCINKHRGGTGFVNAVDSGTVNFQTLMEEVTDTNVTDIIVCGGYNDKNYGATDVWNGIKAFRDSAVSRWPWVKIYVGFIGWSNLGSDRIDLLKCQGYYQHASQILYPMRYLNGVEYSLAIGPFKYFSSDGIHPNDLGMEAVTKNIYQAFLTGSTSSKSGSWSTMGLTYNSGVTSGSFSQFAATNNNGIIQVSQQDPTTFDLSNGPSIGGGTSKADYELATVTSGPTMGNNWSIQGTTVPCIIRLGSTYYNSWVYIRIKQKKLILKVFAPVNSSGNAYVPAGNLTQIQLPPFYFTADALWG